MSHFKLPLLSRINYWLGFGYLAKYGQRLSGMPEDHHFQPSLGTWLFRRGEQNLLRWCEKNVPEHRQDIPIQTIEANQATPEFMAEMRKKQLPVLIKNGAAHWRAVQEFDFDFFANRYGDVEVPAHAEPNKVFADDGKPVPLKNFYQMSYIKIKDLINSIKSDGKYSAKAIEDIMHVDGGNLIDQYCDLKHIHALSGLKEYMKKWYFKKMPLGYVVSKQLFIQSGRSHTLWHTEPGYNYFVAVKGLKHWRVAPPYISPGMYPVIKDSTSYHVSKVDGREENDVISRRGFPLYKYMPKYSAIVEPGDILVMPHFWWHMVNNLNNEPSISLSFRTIAEPNMYSPMFNFLRSIDPEGRRVKQKVLKHGRLFDEDIAASLYSFADPKNDLRKNKSTQSGTGQ